MQTGYFYCELCHVKFSITVEAHLSEEVCKKEYPKSVDWLKKVATCPVCENEVEED